MTVLKRLPQLVLTLAMALTLAMPASVNAQSRERGDGPGRDRERQRDQDRERPDKPVRGDHTDRPERRERPGGDDFDKNRPGRVPVERVEEAFEIIRKLHPDGMPKRLQMLERVMKRDPEEATRIINRFPRIFELMEMHKNNPEEFELHADQIKLTRKAFTLLKQLNEAKNQGNQAKIDDVRKRLRQTVRDIYQVRLEMKRIEIARFKERLRLAAEDLKKREMELTSLENDQEKLIDERLEDLEKRGPAGLREEGDRPKPGHDHGRKPGRDVEGDNDGQQTPQGEPDRDDVRERLRERLRERQERERQEREKGQEA